MNVTYGEGARAKSGVLADERRQAESEEDVAVELGRRE